MQSSTSIVKHTLPPPPGLIECDSVLDIGAGIRPMQWYTPKEHICAEPFRPYVEILRAAGYVVFMQTAQQFLNDVNFAGCYPVQGWAEMPDAVYLLDVLEHMHKVDGMDVIELAQKCAKKQVVIFTPKGFTEQTEDVWNLGGEYWQTHRSGWLPGEFPGWAISFFDEGFFAVWSK